METTGTNSAPMWASTPPPPTSGRRPRDYQRSGGGVFLAPLPPAPAAAFVWPRM